MSKYLGIDFGMRRIGIAISDSTATVSRLFEVIDLQKEKKIFNKLASVVKDNGIIEVIIGLPKNMDGSLGPQAEKTIEFSKELEKNIEVPVKLWDERLTTVAAQRVLIDADVSRKKRKQVIDGLAAQLILQGYLDWKKNQK